MPNETALEAIQNAAKPVTLDVEDDFSARFMKAKKSNIEKNGLNDQEYQPVEGEPEDIGNTKIDFEITEDKITEGEGFSDDNDPVNEQQNVGEMTDDSYENSGEYAEEYNYEHPEEYSGDDNYEAPEEYDEEYNYEQSGEYTEDGTEYETDDGTRRYRDE